VLDVFLKKNIRNWETNFLLKKIFPFVVVVLFIGVFVGYYLAPVDDFQGRISDLESQTISLQSQVDSLQEQVTSKDARIMALESLNADLMKKSNLTVLGVYFSPQGGCED